MGHGIGESFELCVLGFQLLTVRRQGAVRRQPQVGLPRAVDDRLVVGVAVDHALVGRLRGDVDLGVQLAFPREVVLAAQPLGRVSIRDMDATEATELARRLALEGRSPAHGSGRL